LKSITTFYYNHKKPNLENIVPPIPWHIYMWNITQSSRRVAYFWPSYFDQIVVNRLILIEQLSMSWMLAHVADLNYDLCFYNFWIQPQTHTIPHLFFVLDSLYWRYTQNNINLIRNSMVVPTKKHSYTSSKDMDTCLVLFSHRKTTFCKAYFPPRLRFWRSGKRERHDDFGRRTKNDVWLLKL
jgi:hypothetical protein